MWPLKAKKFETPVAEEEKIWSSCFWKHLLQRQVEGLTPEEESHRTKSTVRPENPWAKRRKLQGTTATSAHVGGVTPVTGSVWCWGVNYQSQFGWCIFINIFAYVLDILLDVLGFFFTVLEFFQYVLDLVYVFVWILLDFSVFCIFFVLLTVFLCILWQFWVKKIKKPKLSEFQNN